MPDTGQGPQETSRLSLREGNLQQESAQDAAGGDTDRKQAGRERANMLFFLYFAGERALFLEAAHKLLLRAVRSASVMGGQQWGPCWPHPLTGEPLG